jgi:hypothetical protein
MCFHFTYTHIESWLGVFILHKYSMELSLITTLGFNSRQLQEIFLFLFFLNHTSYFLSGYQVLVFKEKAARVWNWSFTPIYAKI